jgi:hypothetical protein
MRHWDATTQQESLSSLDRFLMLITPQLDRPWDLFNEPPAEVHVVRLGVFTHILASVMHHAAGDAATVTEFGKHCLLEYHRQITGSALDNRCHELGVSTSAKRQARPRRASWRNAPFRAANTLLPIIGPHSLARGTGQRGDTSQHHVKCVLPPEQSRAVWNNARQARASLVDLMAACSNVSMDLWNHSRGWSSGPFTTSMTVNMRGRFSSLGGPNASALLYFRSTPRQRKDGMALARAISLARIRQMRTQIDRDYYDNVARMNSALAFFPFHIRRRLVHRFTEMHQLSAAVTFMGVIWPEDRNGRPTASSCLTRAADLDVAEIHGIGYKLLSSTPLLVIGYVFRTCLNFVLAAAGQQFTRGEAEAFLDLYVNLITTGFRHTLNTRN